MPIFHPGIQAERKNPILNDISYSMFTHYSSKFSPWTDHFLIECWLEIPNKKIGPGYWKLNFNLMENNIVIKEINQLLHDVSDVGNWNVNWRKATMWSTVWDQAKVKIKETLKKISRQLRSQKSNNIKMLNKKLETLLA